MSEGMIPFGFLFLAFFMGAASMAAGFAIGCAWISHHRKVGMNYTPR